MPRPPFIGLTGGIGAGKSEALKALGRLGAATVSTDALAHEALSDPSVVAQIAERWGDAVVDGLRPDRDRIAEIVFGDEDELTWLESVLHPRVREAVMSWRETLDPAARVAVVEVPLLHESEMSSMFDAVVCVVADGRERRRRAEARGLLDFEGRADRQLSQDEKARRSTHVVRNDGTLAELERELETLLPELEALSS